MSTPAPGFVAGHYRIAASCREPISLGGHAAYPVQDELVPSRPLLAILTEEQAPPRARILAASEDLDIPHAMLPIDAGPGCDQAGRHGWFIICDAAPGASLASERRSWREQDLMTCLMKPAARALAALHDAGLTHRSIRPDNIFRENSASAATLGPFWAAPPASLQPAAYEPPYSAWCMKAGRGDGTAADDVYALGATMLALFRGGSLLGDMEDQAMLRRKLEIGSYAALAGDVSVPPLLADLLRVMLAEDPEHRPSAALLLRPEQARARRVASRPPRRALRPLEVGTSAVVSARELAYAIGQDPERGCVLLKSGVVDRWLRRALGDPQLAALLDETLHAGTRGGGRGDGDAETGRTATALTAMQAVAILDPLAPLTWQGVTIFPDGLGGAVARSQDDQAAALEQIVAQEIVLTYNAMSERRLALPAARTESREWYVWQSTSGPGSGMRRVAYGLEPLLCCQSPLLNQGKAARLADLLPALEAASASADRKRPPIDPHVAAFVLARADPALAGDLATLSNFGEQNNRLIVLRLFARLQARLHPGALPGIAGWLVESGFASLDNWQGRTARKQLAETLDRASKAGRITDMLDAVDDPAALAADDDLARRAAGRIANLERALTAIKTNTGSRMEAAHDLGYEIATGMGLIATLGAAFALALR